MNPLKKKPRTKNITPPPVLPEWMKQPIKFPLPEDPIYEVRKSINEGRLNTVCESASCPNLNHCWSRKTATYMLNGDICTRRCKYCDVAFGKPNPIDFDEPKKVAISATKLGLKYVVLTSVNRDDDNSNSARIFAETIFEIRKSIPNIQIEVLIPDFKNKDDALAILFDSKPDIINHNIETVEELFPEITPQKNYSLSLDVLKKIHSNGFITKSGLILGLGESINQTQRCITDLYNNGVRVLTIGQYLQPSPTHFPVQKYYTPEEFDYFKKYSKSLGFKHVESGPMVRSSYHADEQINF
jgi:lipoyl synthase